ncbi:MAG: zf-HC2 domain-containing protein [Treponema sp.]|nr:zf-HC2 domain-containing protein [Treponema sp.]
MCPDRQIISLYFDGELPSPWNEKMAAHLETCPHCQAVLAAYKNLGRKLEKLHRETIETAQDRVWKKITAPELIIAGRPSRKPAGKSVSQRLASVGRVWHRRVTLPLPAAAAAALAVCIAFFALFGLRDSSPQHHPVAVMDIGFDDYAMVPIHDMSDIIRYLSVQESADFMVIRLPEHRNFSRSGQPALINASDYTMRRRNFHR